MTGQGNECKAINLLILFTLIWLLKFGCCWSQSSKNQCEVLSVFLSSLVVMYVSGRYQTAHVATHHSVLLSMLVTSHQAVNLKLSWHTPSWAVFSDQLGEDSHVCLGRDWHSAAVSCQNFPFALHRATSLPSEPGVFFCLSDAFKYWANHMLP